MDVLQVYFANVFLVDVFYVVYRGKYRIYHGSEGNMYPGKKNTCTPRMQGLMLRNPYPTWMIQEVGING